MTGLSEGRTDDQRRTTNDDSYTFALAFNLTSPLASSTEYSTLSQLYFLRICCVFFCTKVVNESKLPETFSPAFFLAATRVLYRRSTSWRSDWSTLCRVNARDVLVSGAAAAAAAAAALWPMP